MQFQVAATVPVYFQQLAADRTRLWITTEAGVITVDPVAERWTTVYADSQPLGSATVVPCESRIWLLGRDTVLLADPEAQRFEVRPLGPPETPAPRRRIEARCAAKGLWTYDGARLFHVPTAGAETKRYVLPSFGDNATVRDFVDAVAGGVYFLVYLPRPTGGFALARFDTGTGALTRIDLPTALGAHGIAALDRADDRVLVRTYDRRVFVMQGAGESWGELTPPGGATAGGPVLAHDNGVVWVGASYDVSPASYFVLRYIRDAMQPQDLVVLSDFWARIRSRPRSALQHLGMLWIAADRNLLRIDPATGELVSYRAMASGALEKQVFRVTQDGGELRYFDGDSLSPLPGIKPAAPDSEPADSVPPADLGQEPESQRPLNRDLPAVEFQVRP